MTIALLSLIAVLLLICGVLAALALLLVRQRAEALGQLPPVPTELLADLVRERFVVTLLSGDTFDGLLDEVDARTVVLVAASAVHPDGQQIPVDGALVLRRDAVAYMQKP